MIATLAPYLLALPLVAATPSPKSLSSSFSLLYQNDLNWTSATEHAGAILLEPRSGQAAVQSCAALSESLLSANGLHFFSDIASLLAYLSFQGRYPAEQEYWIAPASANTCTTITGGAKVKNSSCQRVLPVLCSQSAPYRVASLQDQDPRWRLSVGAEDLTVTGYRDHLSFRFLGIPYANTPKRFTYSTLYNGTQKSLNATDYGSRCVQIGTPGSEDCLFLNIFTPFIPGPETGAASLKPVMFFIHGGAFVGGSGNDAIYDGGNLASRGDVVVVNINYRLSSLGFLALSDGVTNGNFGIGDITVALSWVQKYISAFGGDPTRITIVGQSSGAAATRALLASPKAINKFSAAIPMSNLAGENYATSYSVYYTIAELQPIVIDPLLVATGCNMTDSAAVLSCLRSVDPNTLVDLPTAASFIVVDGTYVTSKQLPVDGSSPVAYVPIVTGIMRDDGSAFTGYPRTANVTREIAAVLSSPSAPEVQSSGLFPVPSGANATLDIFNVTARLSTDIGFRCLDQAHAISASDHNVFPNIWFYQFDRSYQTPAFNPNPPVCDAPITSTHPHGDPSQEYFKCHTGELHFVWGTLGQYQLPFRDANDLSFSQLVADSWTAFAHNHDPNPLSAYLSVRGYMNTLDVVENTDRWEPLTKRHDRALRIMNLPPRMTTFQEESQCKFLGLPSDYYD
ncbi:carboxylesterase from carbohydrate esterase [Punctularia strigosozonata HHB-11173 SS5]|uniref:carboxylesterase from carbohydrate esterase n=1 Tax=Punctularia strigosozonata (strain HHB-11173) TaxID=741275 RepID=UPI0004418404|nr:carboxylesterase from carbohydrate esterase [Punctularia strigosozonata HHB-11173 SS5]EIN14742.1 carboxylesterase from carbohydrate esterase [Punctularia strigosozonata HHB-11173 SS5]